MESSRWNFPCPKFGSRYGISQQRFQTLLRYLRFCPPEEFEVLMIDGHQYVGQPKGVGAELKDAACSQTHIIALEIQEGKEEMATKKYMQEWKKAGTAQVLRLTEPWHGSGRVINADSAFASVTTAEACRKYGLHFTGSVKTATTKFPMKYLNDLEYNK